jgi:hypothetical protein
MLRLTLAEFADHKVFARFDTGDAVTITVYNRTDNVTEVLTSNACSEIGVTGIFEWNFSNLDTQPAGLTQYVWVMSNGASTQDGIAVAAGYPETIMARLADLIATPSGPISYENPWFVGNLPAGGTVTIKVYDSDGVEEALDDSDCDEYIPGYYRWSTANMTTYPAVINSYMWIMVDAVSGRTTWGVGPIGVPEDITTVTADAVWDAARADYTDIGSMGETMTDVQAVVESLDEMIEDDGLGNDRFTAKALEEAPVSAGVTVQEIWEYIFTGDEPAGSSGDTIVTIQDLVEGLNNLSESDMIRIITALQRRLNPNGGLNV